MGLLDYIAQPKWAIRMEQKLGDVLYNQTVIDGKLEKMARTVDEALQGLVDVAVDAIGQLKAAKQELQDLKDSDAATDAAQIQEVLDSVADRIDAATASLTAPEEIPVEPTEPPAEVPPVDEPVDVEPLPEVDPNA